MIVFNLICSTCEIEFEGWFGSSSDFQEQKRKKLIQKLKRKRLIQKKQNDLKTIYKKNNTLIYS